MQNRLNFKYNSNKICNDHLLLYYYVSEHDEQEK